MTEQDPSFGTPLHSEMPFLAYSPASHGVSRTLILNFLHDLDPALDVNLVAEFVAYPGSIAVTLYETDASGKILTFKDAHGLSYAPYTRTVHYRINDE